MAGSRGLFGLALAMSLIAGLSAADSSPDAVLKARGLTKAGTRYLLDEDINLRAALRVERQAKSHLDAELAKRAAIDRQLRSARESELQLYAQVLDLRARAEKVKNIPYRYNELGAQVNQALAQIRDAEAYIADRQKALNELTVPYDEYTAAIVDLSERMERAQKEYERLGSDAQVTSALARLNAEARVPYKLGPSDTFATELQSIRRERDSDRFGPADADYALSRVLFPNCRSVYVGAMVPMLNRGTMLFDRGEVGHPSELVGAVAPVAAADLFSSVGTQRDAILDCVRMPDVVVRPDGLYMVHVPMSAVTFA